MNDAKTGGNDWAAKRKSNTTSLKVWTAAWVLTTAIAAFGAKLVWDYAPWPTIGAQFLNMGAGVGMIIATCRYVQGMDELQQKIFLQAGAITLGVGLVSDDSQHKEVENQKEAIILTKSFHNMSYVKNRYFIKHQGTIMPSFQLTFFPSE